MCDSGNAVAIMGNHEFNAICFHTKDKTNGGFFRKHTIVEIEQHIETLRQFKNLLAWYAVEEISRQIIEEKENKKVA